MMFTVDEDKKETTVSKALKKTKQGYEGDKSREEESTIPNLWAMNEGETYKAKGLATFAVTSGDKIEGAAVGYYTKDRNELDPATIESLGGLEFDRGNMMSGIRFLRDVSDGHITECDGKLGHVIVNGYVSNIGLVIEDKFCQGYFLMNARAFAQLCKDRDVLVVWHER